MAIRDIVTTAKTYRPYTGENGLYVSRVPDELSVDKLVNLAHSFKLCTMDEDDINELHCTIMWSKTPASNPDPNDMHPVIFPCCAWVVRVEFWPGHDNDGYLVACLESKSLQSIHRLWKLRGGVPSFPDYTPHVTLKTPFAETKELTYRLKQINAHLAAEPILIRLVNETVEDIKKKVEVDLIQAT